MAGFFSSRLVVALVKQPSGLLDRATWELLEPLAFVSEVAGEHITVPAGFVTDFASVPRLFLSYAVAGDTAHPAAVVHDWLYSQSAVPRAEADAVFREAMAACGVPIWRRWIMYLGVRAFGWLARSWKPG